ncbi:MAG TPA: glycosyltransferase family 4 protein [Pseudonocardiaceae bacterium]|nr:glycosyltransferase family 4 protein [Pseudonocardiaceae bacterium]
MPWDLRLSNTPIGLRWRGMLREIIRREQPSLVNAHAPVPGLADLTAMVVGERGFVLTYHTGPMRKDSLIEDVLVRSYQRLVLPKTLSRTDLVITSSDYVRANLPQPFREDAVTIHPGIDPETFAPGAPEPFGLPPHALFVGSLAKAARYKNLPDLLRALRHLKDQGCHVNLTIVGDGDARRDYEELTAALGLSWQVSFAGILTGVALTAAYQRSSFLVLPTLFDSFGTVLAETMACARPVVATTAGGITEIVTSGVDGLLVPPGDRVQLSSAIRTLADNYELRTRFGLAARHKVTTRLTWRLQAERTITAFRAVMSRYPGRLPNRACGDIA